ncbi:hypothetical protein [Gordonia terrae]
MTETSGWGIEDRRAPWNWFAIDGETARSELDAEFLYEYSDDWMPYDELVNTVSAEAATIPPNEARWRDGVFDADEYIDEACSWGVIGRMEIRTCMTTDYTDGQYRWTADDLRAKVDLHRSDFRSFDKWLAAALERGDYREVRFLQYIGDEDPTGPELKEHVVLERRIVD